VFSLPLADIASQEREGRRQAKVPARRQALPREILHPRIHVNGWKPGANEQIISMAANASGIRDTARALGSMGSRRACHPSKNADAVARS